MDLFIHDVPAYKKYRNLDLFENWIRYTAYEISVSKSIPLEQADSWVRWALKHKKISYTDPYLNVFIKDEHRDRHATRMKLSSYLKYIEKNNLIMIPTLTCYLPTSQMESELSIYTKDRFYLRKRTKKEGQLAKSLGKLQEATDKNNLQNKLKEDINSISGLLTIASTPLANRSGHSTLTSTCRTDTALSNATVERFLAGRRHFFDGPSAVENIVSILAEVDLNEAKSVLDRFNLHLVTAEEMLPIVLDCTVPYFKSEKWINYIKDFVYKLTPLQCTTWLYMGDFHSVMMFNPEFVREMFDRVLDYQDLPPLSKEETISILNEVDEFYQPFVTVMMSSYVGSKSIFTKEYQDEPWFGLIGARAKHVKDTLYSYKEFIQYFWRSDFLPAETASFPDVYRKNVLGGDTDSTFKTVMNWVQWYDNTTVVNEHTRLTANLLIFILTNIIKHGLACISAQFGTDDEYRFNMKMKNEFYFEVQGVSNRTKHYGAIQGMQEGNALAHKELEVKGVALKNSKSTKDLQDRFASTMESIMLAISRGEKISATDYITDVASIEATIFNSVMHGDTDYLTSRAIKVKEAYTIPMQSDYANYVLWTEVFADKYGACPEPPYEGVRIAMDLPNKTAVNLWLDSLKDQQIAENFRNYIARYDKKAMASIILPVDIVVSLGIPDEIKPIVNTRKIIYANTEPYYILAEMMGIYRINQWFTKMFLDERLEMIDTSLRRYFENEDDTLDTIRQKARSDGVAYEEYDKPLSEEQLEELKVYGTLSSTTEDDEDIDEDDYEDE